MRISHVRVLLLSAPIPPERRWTSDFGTNTKQDLSIVIVETNDGLTGFGEAKGTPLVMKVLVEGVLGPQLVGEDPTRVEFLWEKIYSASRLPLALAHGRPCHRAGSRGETIHAISGVDVALWDIYGKSLGVPIYRLLGGGLRERMPAYASGGCALPEGTADEVLGYRAKGFNAVKRHWDPNRDGHGQPGSREAEVPRSWGNDLPSGTMTPAHLQAEKIARTGHN